MQSIDKSPLHEPMKVANEMGDCEKWGDCCSPGFSAGNPFCQETNVEDLASLRIQQDQCVSGDRPAP